MKKSSITLKQSSKIINKDSLSPLSSSFNYSFSYKEYQSFSPIDSNYNKGRLEKKQNYFNHDKNKFVFNQLLENNKRKRYINLSNNKFLDHSVIRRIAEPPKKKRKKRRR